MGRRHPRTDGIPGHNRSVMVLSATPASYSSGVTCFEKPDSSGRPHRSRRRTPSSVLPFEWCAPGQRIVWVPGSRGPARVDELKDQQRNSSCRMFVVGLLPAVRRRDGPAGREFCPFASLRLRRTSLPSTPSVPNSPILCWSVVFCKGDLFRRPRSGFQNRLELIHFVMRCFVRPVDSVRGVGIDRDGAGWRPVWRSSRRCVSADRGYVAIRAVDLERAVVPRANSRNSASSSRS